MPDTLPPLELPRLPTHVARPPRRERVPDPWRTRVVGAVLLAHVVGVVVVDRSLGLRERPPVASAPVETVFEVRFVPPDPEPVAVPAPTASVTSPLPAPARPQPPTAPPPTRDDGVAVEFLPATPEPSIDTRRLFDPNGAVRLPDGFVDREAPAPRDPMAPPSSPVPFERTRFDAAWEPDGETLAQQAVRIVPPLGILLSGAYEGPNCPPNSTDIRCEAMAQEQRARIPPTPQSAKQPW